jgi:hypothetical protein
MSGKKEATLMRLSAKALTWPFSCTYRSGQRRRSVQRALREAACSVDRTIGHASKGEL